VCLNSVCDDCVDKLSKCPHCRAEPYDTLSLATRNDAKPMNLTMESRGVKHYLGSLNYIANKFNSSCTCRINCKHSRCNCVFHNSRYEGIGLCYVSGDLSNWYKTYYKSWNRIEREWFTKNVKNKPYNWRRYDDLLHYEVKFPAISGEEFEDVEKILKMF
jgi:hypothetical protein